MKLSSQQITQIRSSLSQRRIYYSDIREELLDHTASKVEELIEHGFSFEEALGQVQKEINPSTFQRKMLIYSHLGFFKKIFSNLFRVTIILKSIPVFAVYLSFVYLYDLSPEEAQTQIKTICISNIFGLALMALWGGLLKNSQIVSAGNSLWLTIFISQFFLDLDVLVWFGLSPLHSIFLITFSLSLLFISGLSEIVGQAKRLKIA